MREKARYSQNEDRHVIVSFITYSTYSTVQYSVRAYDMTGSSSRTWFMHSAFCILQLEWHCLNYSRYDLPRARPPERDFRHLVHCGSPHFTSTQLTNSPAPTPGSRTPSLNSMRGTLRHLVTVCPNNSGGSSGAGAPSHLILILRGPLPSLPVNADADRDERGREQCPVHMYA